MGVLPGDQETFQKTGGTKAEISFVTVPKTNVPDLTKRGTEELQTVDQPGDVGATGIGCLASGLGSHEFHDLALDSPYLGTVKVVRRAPVYE